MANFSWLISQLDTFPLLDGMEKVIIAIHWRAQKQHGGLNWSEDFTSGSLTPSFTADTYGSMLVDAPHEASFTPYDEVTKEMVEGWLQDSLDCEAIEANLDAQIQNFLNPPIVNYGLPWSDPAKI